MPVFNFIFNLLWRGRGFLCNFCSFLWFRELKEIEKDGRRSWKVNIKTGALQVRLRTASVDGVLIYGIYVGLCVVISFRIQIFCYFNLTQ
jgi:hypothetical protein